MLNKQIPVITELQDRSALYDGYQTVGKVHLSAPDIMTIEKIKPSPSGNDAKYDLVDLGRLPAEVSDLSGLFRQLGGMPGAADSTILFSVPNALSLDYLSDQYFIDTVGKTERRMTYSGICRFLAENGYEITAVAAEEKSTGSFQQLTQSVPYRSDDHRDQRFFRIRQTDFLVFGFHCAVNMKKLCFLKAVKQRGKVCQIRSRFF